MRQGLDSTTETLYLSGSYDLHSRIKCENGSGTMVDLNLRFTRVGLKKPDIDEPIGSLSMTFIRETTEAGGTTSLNPLVAASTLNRLDDGSTYDPLLQLGRQVTLEVALTAIGGSRPADGATTWYEIFRGVIRRVDGGQYEGQEARVEVNGLGAVLGKSEAEYTYEAGTSIETVAQEILTNNGHGSVVLDFPSATGKVLPNDYAPGLQKTVWSQLWSLAQSMGWIMYYRYTGQNTLKLTFFEPERSKTTPDMTVDPDDFGNLSIDEDEVRNVGYLVYYDAAGKEQMVGPAEDTVSITKYGGSLGIRRPFWIKLEKDSPIRSAADAVAMLNAALSDVADPDVVAVGECVPLVFGEVGIDLYTVPARDRFFDSDQTLSPVNISVTFQSNQEPRSSIGLRGVPTAGAGSWRRLGREPFKPDFPEGYAHQILDTDGALLLSAGTDGGNSYTDRIYYAQVLNPASNTDFPEVDDTSEYVEAADFPYVDRILDSSGDPIFPKTGDVSLLTARMWSESKGWGSTIYHVLVGAGANADRRVEIFDIREIGRTLTEITYGFQLGEEVDNVYLYRSEFDLPVTEDPWPTVLLNLTDVLGASDTEFTVPIPPQDKVTHVQLEPFSDDGVNGPVRRLTILPLQEEPDKIVSLDVKVNQEDGSAVITVSAPETADSVRYAFDSDSSPTAPLDAAVEAGTVEAIDSFEAIALPAGTVGLGETLIVRVAGYINEDGTGADGTAADHGEIVEARDTRTKLRVPQLEIVSQSEDGTDGSFRVKVIDPDNLATNLYKATKSGSGAASSFSLVAMDPAHESEYTETVTLQERHLSFVIFRLDYTLGGEAGSTTLISNGFDKGRLPFGTIIGLVDEDTGNVTAVAIGDVDTIGWYILASTDPADINIGDITSTSYIAGRTLTAADVGTLLTAQYGQYVYIGAVAVGPDGNAEDIARADVVYLNIAPLLKETEASESGGTGTHKVTVDDPAGQAGLLEYSVREGEGEYGGWTTAANPAGDGVEYTATVPLTDGHLSFIRWRLTYTLRGDTFQITLTSPGFDKGKIPDGTVQIFINEDREVFPIAIGGFDTAKWKLAASTVSRADAATGAGVATPVSQRSVLPTDFVSPLTSVLYGQTVYLAGIPLDEDDNAGPTIYAEVYFNIAREPSFRIVDESETSTTGTFRVELIDPDSLVTGVEARRKVGPTAWTNPFTSTTVGSDEYEETVTLVEGHNSFLEFIATYVIDGVTKYLPFKSNGFDPGQIPNVLGITAAFDSLGVLRVTVNCDSDADQFWVYAHNSGHQSRSTTKTGTNVSGPSGVVTFSAPSNGGAWASGDTAFITVVAIHDATSLENTNVAQATAEFVEATGEGGNFVRGTPRWIKGADGNKFSILCDLEVGEQTATVEVEYTDPGGSSLISGDTASVTAPNADFLVTSSSTAVQWANGAQDVTIQLTPKTSGGVAGNVKVFKLKQPGTAAETAAKVITQGGTEYLTDAIKARANRGIDFELVGNQANAVLVLGDKVTISDSSDASGTPTDASDVALWIRVT